MSRPAAWTLLLLLLLLPMAAEAQSVSSDVATAYSSAAALQDRGLYDLAAKEWAALLKAHADDPLAARARLNLGVCRFQQSDFAGAAAEFERAVASKHAKDVAENALANLGLARFNQAASASDNQSDKAKQNYRQAIKAFQKLLTDYPKSNQAPTAHFYRGECHAACGEPEQAAASYQAVLAEPSGKPMHASARLGLAAAEIDLKLPAQAEKTLDALLSTKPSGEQASEAYRLRGEARLAGGKFKASAEDFRQASADNAYRAADESLDRQAFALYSAGEFAQAAKVYESLPKRFPGSSFSHGADLAAGKCLMRAGQGEQAARLLGALWKRSPTANNAEAAHWLVQTLLKQKQHQQAATLASDALQTRPAKQWSAPLTLALADALMELPNQRGDAQQLYQQYAKAHSGTPDGKRAAYLAAYAALELKQDKEARRLALDFLKRNAGHKLAADARLVAAEACTRLGRRGEAVNQYRKLLDASSNDPRANAWTVRLAALLRENNDWRATADLLASRVDQLSGDAQENALLQLAEAQQSAGDREASGRTLSRFIANGKDPQRIARALYMRGELLCALNRQGDANRDFSRVAKQHPQHKLAPYALYALASNQFAAGELRAAEVTLRQLLSPGPNAYRDGPLAEARMLAASVFYQSKQYDKALRVLPDAQGDAADKLYLRGVSHAGLKQHDQAKRALTQLLTKHRDHKLADQAMFELAWLLRESEPHRAVVYFQQLAKDYPKSPLVGEALLRAGELLYSDKQHDAARQAFTAAAEAKSAETAIRAQALHLLGWSHFDQGQHQQALSAFDRQLAVAPNAPLAADAHTMRGECLFALKQYQRAYDAYSKSRQPPRDPALRTLSALHAAQAAAQLGKWSRSLDWLDRAEKASKSKRDEIAYERGWAMVNLKRTAEAKPIFEKLAEANAGPLSARARFMLGEIQFADKQHEQAVRTFFRVAYGYGGKAAPKQYHTWQAESLFEAARCLEALDRKPAAKKLYVELLERFPESPKARHARSRLQSGMVR